MNEMKTLTIGGQTFKVTDESAKISEETKIALGLTDATVDEALGKLSEAVMGGVKIETGSYTGTGTYGASNPCSLTFDFKPKIVWIYACKHSSGTGGYKITNLADGTSSGAGVGIIPMAVLTTSYVQYMGFKMSSGSSGSNYGKKSSNGKTIYWYNSSDQWQQLNETGATYYYLYVY